MYFELETVVEESVVAYVKALFCMSAFLREVDENCPLLGYDAASSDNFLLTFRDKLSVPSSGRKGTLTMGPIRCPVITQIPALFCSLRVEQRETSLAAGCLSDMCICPAFYGYSDLRSYDSHTKHAGRFAEAADVCRKVQKAKLNRFMLIIDRIP
jgi:hypothetical protein